MRNMRNKAGSIEGYKNVKRLNAALLIDCKGENLSRRFFCRGKGRGTVTYRRETAESMDRDRLTSTHRFEPLIASLNSFFKEQILLAAEALGRQHQRGMPADTASIARRKSEVNTLLSR
jgi:hypothetical protein